MPLDFEDLCKSLSMTDIIRLQTMLSSALVQRFEQRMGLAFSDLVGSTAYFSKFGDEAGRRMQQKHIDLLQQAISSAGGRIVDTAGDGAFLCFPDVDGAAGSMVELLKQISAENSSRTREHQLAVRIGIHQGPVLTDGVHVTGDSVNYCARVTGTSAPGEIRITREAFFAFTDVRYRLKCHKLPAVEVKGIDRPAELMRLDWRDHAAFPTRVRLETGEEYTLPDQDIISFGRLKEREGRPANDIVLQCLDESLTLQISRWHFELRRHAEMFVIRSVTGAPTVLNSRPLEKGEECPIRPGDCVRVGNALSLHFEGPHQGAESSSGMMTITAPVNPCSADHSDGTGTRQD